MQENPLMSRDFRKLVNLLQEIEEITRLHAESECKHEHCGTDLTPFNFKINLEPSHGRSYFSISHDNPTFQTIRDMMLTRKAQLEQQVKEQWEQIKVKTADPATVEQLDAWFLSDYYKKKQ